VESAEFPELQFGNIRATNIRLLIFDLASVTEFADGLDGILGLDVLADSRISIDYDTKKLVIEHVEPTSRDLANQIDTVCTTATANINGVSFHLIVDTGMPGILLYGSRVRERLPSSQTPNARLVRVGNEMLASELMLDKIMIGNEEIRNVSALVVSSAPVGLPPTIDGIIGTQTLRARRLTLDLGHNTLQWEH
jgi:predicted aspartyl protease